MFKFLLGKKTDNVEALRKEAKKLVRENQHLRRDNERLKRAIELLREDFRGLQLLVKEYQEMLFKRKALKHKSSKNDADDDDSDNGTPAAPGAPNGHPGKTRKVPDRVDEHRDVHLSQCPECSGKNLTPCKRYEDHYQEDIVIPQTKVTRFRHHYYYCPHCKKAVHGTGEGELPGSYIGPAAKSLAGFLHYQMSTPYRKIKQLFKEFFSMDFDPSSCVGFDWQIRIRGSPLYEELTNNLKDKPYLHVDETGWRNHWLWCFAGAEATVYKIQPGRGQKDLRSVLGDRYSGVLVSDFLHAYNRIKSVKQRCLVHMLRLIDKWMIYYDHDPKTVKYLTALKKVVRGIIRLSGRMKEDMPKNFAVRKADLKGRLRRLLTRELKPPKADRFRRKLLDHFNELVTCLDFAEVSAHNNLAERMLRGNVIMRKITFGNRSEKGIKNHEVIMSLIQTARQQGVNPLTFLNTLLTNRIEAATALSLNLTSAR